MDQCEAITKKGTPCTRKAHARSHFCKTHTPVGLSPAIQQSVETFHPNADQSPYALACELYTHGVTVITDTWLAQHNDWLESALQQMLTEMPEYKIVPERFVRGGFSALGNPSSFHHPLLRQIRQWAMWCVVPILGQYLTLPEMREKYDKFNLEQIPDRLMIRPPGVKVGAETWHRDEAVNVRSTDITFGGWQNFDRVTQYFSCVINSHTIGQRDGQGGFNRLTPKEVEEYSIDPNRRHIAIPSGAIVLFHENIVHEVLPAQIKDRSVKRLFFGWRLTDSKSPMFPDLMDRITRQAPFQLKSGQEPPMYPQTTWMYESQRKEMVQWSQETFVDSVLREHIFKCDTPDEQVLLCIDRFMCGLKDYGLPLYPMYTDVELGVYQPNREWRVLIPGEKEKYGKVSL